MLSREGIWIDKSWREDAMVALSSETIRPVEQYAHNLLQTALLNREAFNESEYATHLNYAYLKTESLEKRGINTENLHSTVTSNGKRSWSPERENLHHAIINSFLTKWANIPCHREAVLSGGLAGGGKTTTLTQHTHYDLNNYAFLSPDDVKEAMSENGMFPEIRGLTPMEVSALGYEESSYITNMLFQDCVNSGRNLIFDTTMGSTVALDAKLNPLRDHAYDIRAVFVDIQISTSLRRSQERHRHGLNEFITTGSGFGGRLLPRYAVKRQVPSNPKISSKNRELFNDYRSKGWFVESHVFDNNVDGRAPKLIAH